MRTVRLPGPYATTTLPVVDFVPLPDDCSVRRCLCCRTEDTATLAARTDVGPIALCAACAATVHEGALVVSVHVESAINGEHKSVVLRHELARLRAELDTARAEALHAERLLESYGGPDIAWRYAAIMLIGLCFGLLSIIMN